jgi:hypothetical protein
VICESLNMPLDSPLAASREHLIDGSERLILEAPENPAVLPRLS